MIGQGPTLTGQGIIVNIYVKSLYLTGRARARGALIYNKRIGVLKDNRILRYGIG